MLVGGFLVNVGSFSVYPYMAVLLRERMDMRMAQVGVVLGLATLVQFAGAPVTAAVAERVGLQRSLVVALVLYSLGGGAFLAGEGIPALTIAGLLLISGGGSLYSPAYRSYLVHGAGSEQRPRLVSAGNAAGNLGIALGPVVGALLIQRPGEMFAVVTAVYTGVAVGHVFLRRERRAEDAPAVEPFRRMLHGLAVPPFVVTALTFCVHMQFYQYLSSYAQGRVDTLIFGVAMMGYSLILVLVQPLVAQRVERMGYPAAMAIGFGCLAAGMVAFAGGNGLTIMAGVAAISVGSAVLFLKNDLEALARSRRSATVVFGQQRLAIGVGSFLSGVVGGTVYGLFERGGYLPGFWLVVAAQCVLYPVLMSAGRRWAGRRGPAPESST
ncbi:MFS transporter [Sphaerisporangium siamense]|uniref:Putative MFS family arabinose efflux permease n=1 Tax=Sphaerisporangium siamense TaxID=795645 RepID=A0A7W7D9J5_9ACTN|nr:MFS transporter [Sphaerisporangium siamense]MBB4702779.1 putative MFS family arabinose efflux permease [Sphaerisporangium siamense]GII83467.1 MFS transporter [Sphaerisporangium siamense]